MRRRASWGYRSAALLIALAIVPLFGAGNFVRAELDAADSAGENAESVSERAAELVELTELRTRLLDERNWESARSGVASIGIDPSLVVGITGIDIPAEAEKARIEVDRLIGTLPPDQAREVTLQLELIRSDPFDDRDIRGDRFDELERGLAERANQLLDELLALSGSIEDGSELITTVRVLESAGIARQAVSAELTGYFSSQFSGSTRAAEDVVNLIGHSELRAEALAELERIVVADSVAAERLGDIYRSVDARAFDVAIDGAIDEALLDSSQFDPGILDLLDNDLDSIAEVFQQGTRTAVLYFDLVEGAGDDVTLATGRIEAAAEVQRDLATRDIALLTSVSLLLALVTNRAVTRPLKVLAETARRISEGRPVDPKPPFGPIEVRRAHEAIVDAAQHLALAERQAKALAAGDLDHEALSIQSSGALGTSLQRAVKTLAESLQEREVFRRRMIHEATHDSLTQLPNRSAALSHLRSGLARVARAESSLAVLFIDLDGFKPVNDSFGHLAGDELLRITAQRLAAGVREGDHVGRLGGDEFLVIAEPVADVKEATQLAERILAVISEPVELSAGTATVGASIGVALASEGLAASDLLRDADLAVYTAKAEGRGRVKVFDNDLRQALSKEADLEEAIRAAVMRDELVLHFQPIVAAPSDARSPDEVEITGFEALLRWNRPGFGMMSPEHFIPFAERTELIVDLDRWVLMAAARQLSLWNESPRVPIAVNVSARHLKDPHFVDDVLGPLWAHGVDPSRLVLELTESALLDDLDGAAEILQAIRNEGVRIAIDDFGTGYTSVAHLKTLPLDIVKIDRTFTSDVASQSLVQLIIESGHLLGAEIVGEGIETEEQAVLLTRLGADSLQGFLYGRPSDVVTIDRLVRTGELTIRTDPPASRPARRSGDATTIG